MRTLVVIAAAWILRGVGLLYWHVVVKHRRRRVSGSESGASPAEQSVRR